MGTLSRRQNRRLLFRTYAVVVGGLVLVAAALDYGFNRLQAPESPAALAWIDGTLSLVEARLSGLPQSDWADEAVRLQQQLGYPVKVLLQDHVVHSGRPGAATQEVFDAAGRPAYLRHSDQLDAAIQIGPLEVDAADESRLVAWIPTFFYLSIVAVVSLWLWPVLRDVNLLTAAAREFAADYRREMITRDKVKTLQELATSFDEMSERIRGLIQSQKDLTSALSHEVRTPLARIKFAMAVMSDKANVAAELQSIDQDVQEIDRLIGTMLDYARLDHPDTAVSWQPTDIAEWLERSVAKSRTGTLAPTIEVAAAGELVRMDPNLMELALSNLLVNACRYARESVIVRFALDTTEYVLSVDDDGPGIPEDVRENVFKPFTRLDNSRNRSTGGYGLGLAIVARIAARQGGSVAAGQSALGGASLRLRWPRS